MEETTTRTRDQPATLDEIRPRKTTKFASLPDDALFAVFRRCDVQTLGRLCQVCRRLNTLIQSDTIWLYHINHFLLVHSSANDCHKKDINRSNAERISRQMNLKEQLRLSSNWVEKRYRERVLLRLHPRQLPWMQYTGDALWISTNNEIKCYMVQHGQRLKEDCRRHLVLQDGLTNRERCRQQHIVDNEPGPNLLNQDVSRFVVKDNLAVCGCRDGSLYIFDCVSGLCIDAMYKIHRTDTQAVDFHDSCIVSGSRDKFIKIISMSKEDCNNNPVKASLHLEDRVWSVAMSPSGGSFTAGTSGCRGNSSLSVWDIERAELVCMLGSYRYGAGVLDMKYDDNSTLLTCGYDANLRMWDLRCGQCVQEWHEPYDTTLYCLQSDHHSTVITGTARYGMIRLWDKRKREAVQEYFLSQKSPVYSVAFDTSRLYAALDLSVHIMDFSGFPA